MVEKMYEVLLVVAMGTAIVACLFFVTVMAEFIFGG